MPRKDALFIFLLILFLSPFFVFPSVSQFYLRFNAEHGLIMSFIKFAILATVGEVIGLRIRKGIYLEKGFGILPRALVWGILGLTIKMAFVIFSVGTPAFLAYIGFENAPQIMQNELSRAKVGVAFSISLTMNLIYAPVMMTLHKITDLHIIQTQGNLIDFFKPIAIRKIMTNINWDTMWNFVFKRTIPLFWIPAHTITFLLAEDFQILFAALLGIALGVLLAIADLADQKLKHIKIN
ncbi:MAG TPA: hypothetical protein DCG69_05755 [Bacteroidales bacterium]|nr:hypothetical protein [Bacteroidales bacterium]